MYIYMYVFICIYMHKYMYLIYIHITYIHIIYIHIIYIHIIYIHIIYIHIIYIHIIYIHIIYIHIIYIHIIYIHIIYIHIIVCVRVVQTLKDSYHIGGIATYHGARLTAWYDVGQRWSASFMMSILLQKMITLQWSLLGVESRCLQTTFNIITQDHRA